MRAKVAFRRRQIANEGSASAILARARMPRRPCPDRENGHCAAIEPVLAFSATFSTGTFIVRSRLKPNWKFSLSGALAAFDPKRIFIR